MNATRLLVAFLVVLTATLVASPSDAGTHENSAAASGASESSGGGGY